MLECKQFLKIVKKEIRWFRFSQRSCLKIYSKGQNLKYHMGWNTVNFAKDSKFSSKLAQK